MAESLRPLRVVTRNSQVINVGAAGPMLMSIDARIAPGFDRLIRDRGRFTAAQRGVNAVHGNMAFETVMQARRKLEEKVKENPRPNRTGRVGLRQTLATRYEELYTVHMANRASAGFTVDFTRLDHIGPFDAQGRPYWRYVESGFGGGWVKAMFADDGGLHMPSPYSRYQHPRMPNLHGRRAPYIEIAGFAGYHFIEETLKSRAKDIRRRAYDAYVWELDWPPEVREAAVAFMGGGSDRGGVVRTASGTPVRDARRF